MTFFNKAIFYIVFKEMWNCSLMQKPAIWLVKNESAYEGKLLLKGLFNLDIIHIILITIESVLCF